MTLYSEKEIAQLLELYKTGYSYKDISEIMRRSASGLRTKIYELGISSEGSVRKRKIDALVPKMIEMYEKGMTTLGIGKELGCSDSTVNRRLKEIGYDTSHGSGRYSSVGLPRRFEGMDSPETAYWLGYLYGDGSVVGGMIAIYSVDREQLVKFARFIDLPEDKVRSEKRTRKNQVYYIQANSVAMQKDLVQYGIIPRKTYEDSLIWPKKYERDFLRGLVDSDGHIKPNGYGCQITGTKNTIALVSEYLTRHRFHHLIYNGSTPLTFQLHVLRKANVVRFLDHIYKDATVYLDRKYKTYKSLIAPLDSDI